jgi:hypothetical protein
MLAHPTAASTICEGEWAAASVCGMCLYTESAPADCASGHRKRLFAAQNSSGLYRWPLVRHSMGSSSSSHQAPASVGPWGWLQRTFSTQAHAAAITPTAAAQLQHPRKPTHLVVMVNGLFGGPGNWDVVREELQQQLDPQHTILHPSQVNQRWGPTATPKAQQRLSESAARSQLDRPQQRLRQHQVPQLPLMPVSLVPAVRRNSTQRVTCGWQACLPGAHTVPLSHCQCNPPQPLTPPHSLLQDRHL